MNLETPQVTARHFALQQREVTTRSTERGGDYTTQADFGRSPTATTARVAAREEAAISRQQRGTTSTEQSKRFDPGSEGLTSSFLPSGYVVYCMLCYAFPVSPFLLMQISFFYHVRYKMLQELAAEDEGDRDTRTR